MARLGRVMSRQRVMTALVLVPFAILSIVYGTAWWVKLLIVLCVAGLIYEWQHNLCRHAYWVVVLCLVVTYGLAYGLLLRPEGLWIIGGAWVLGGSYFLYRQSQKISPPSLLIDTSLGCVVMAAWASACLLLWQLHPLWLLATCLMVAVVDTAAYYSGRIWGKQRIIPLISPNKTEYGFLGGYLAGVVLGLGVGGFILGMNAVVVVLALLVPFCGIMGDLWASVYKRRYQVKDSGRCLPGHGGLFDRLDSLVVVAPVVMGILLKL